MGQTSNAHRVSVALKIVYLIATTGDSSIRFTFDTSLAPLKAAMAHDTEDDDTLEELFGEAHTLQGLAQRSVHNWRIMAAGQRPFDYAQRDLLIGSCQRDRRQRLFRHMCANIPDWISRRTLHLPEQLRKQACQFSAFQFAHLLHLHQLEGLAGAQEQRIIIELGRCCPIGFELTWRGPGRRSELDVCRHARQCPWCFARSVTGLYRDLASTVLRGREEIPFLLARLSVTSDLFADRQSRTTDITDLVLALQEQCQFVRQQVGKALANNVRLLGADGGLTTFLVGPQLYLPWQRDQVGREKLEGFEYRLAVLGRIAHSTPALEELLDAEAAPMMPTFSALGNRQLDVEYDLLDDPQALRLFVFGSSSGFRNLNGRENITGAFEWPSWSLASYKQWLVHLQATAGMRMWDRWGTWRRTLPAPRQQRRHTRSAADLLAGAQRRQQAFAQQNADGRQSAGERRQILLDHVEMLATLGPQLRQLGHARLRAQLADHGLNVSVRDAKWLASQMKQVAAEASDLSLA